MAREWLGIVLVVWAVVCSVAFLAVVLVPVVSPSSASLHVEQLGDGKGAKTSVEFDTHGAGVTISGAPTGLVATTGAQGEKGDKGADGKNGKDGKDGKDAVQPQLGSGSFDDSSTRPMLASDVRIAATTPSDSTAGTTPDEGGEASGSTASNAADDPEATSPDEPTPTTPVTVKLEGNDNDLAAALGFALLIGLAALVALVRLTPGAPTPPAPTPETPDVELARTALLAAARAQEWKSARPNAAPELVVQIVGLELRQVSESVKALGDRMALDPIRAADGQHLLTGAQQLEGLPAAGATGFEIGRAIDKAAALAREAAQKLSHAGVQQLPVAATTPATTEKP